MASMVDWSRLARGGDPAAAAADLSAQQHKSRYKRQRDSEVIRQAEEQGYFLQASRSFIETVFAPDADDGGDEQMRHRRQLLLDEKGPPKDLTRVRLIHLANAHLRSVGDIGLCVNLRVCILNGNYISRLDGLVQCENLVKLDASSNQISHLPGPDFWAGLQHLKILYLHDNPIGRIESLTYLSGASELAVLTLYDTPLSLKRNYRHHVVNSIWSLKALDNYVVSDEEIIEDAEFGGHFAAYHPAFQVNLYIHPSVGSSFEDHLAVTNGVLAAVNKILARHSPVLIMQRMVRGHLTRKQYNFKTDTHLWAAVTIQRGFRDWKGLPGPHGRPESGPPPPTSPAFGGSQNVDAIKMDYDTYLRNRRPGSTAHSEGSHTSRVSRLSLRTEELKPRSSAGSASSRQRTNLFINLTKLQTGTLQTLQDDAVAIETIFPTEASLGRDDTQRHADTKRTRRKKEAESKTKRIKSIKHFFGPMVKTTHTPEPEVGAADDEDGEIPIICFRLRGYRKPIDAVDPTTELILARREAGRDVRLAEMEHHARVDNAPRPRVKRRSAEEASSLRRALNRAQTTMGLSCLRAVQQAYRDREKMERQAVRIEHVLSQREQREAGRDRTRLFGEERRNAALRDRNSDQNRLLEENDRRDLQRLTSLERSGERHGRSSQHIKQRRSELGFTTDFNVQNTSVSKALMRHDRQAVQEDKLQERNEIVTAHKVVEREQQDIVRKYLEHRQLMRQAEVAMTRAALDTKMLQEANERLIEARTRVAQQKARTANVQATLGLPTIGTPTLLPPVPTKEVRSALVPRPILTAQASAIQRSTTVA